MNESHAVTVTPGTALVPPVTLATTSVTLPATVTVTVAGQRDSHGVTPAVPGHVTPDVPQASVTVPLTLSRLSRRDSAGRARVTHRDSVTRHGRDSGTTSPPPSGTGAGQARAVTVTHKATSPVTLDVPGHRDNPNVGSTGAGTSHIPGGDTLAANAVRSSADSETRGSV